MTDASDIIGFVAAGLVLATFAMKDMRALRATAIISNLAFIVYGAVNGLLPVLTLHLLLLPLNVQRLIDGERSRHRDGKFSASSTNKATQQAIEALHYANAARRGTRRRSQV